MLLQIARRTKMSFKPETLLDFGSGLGTVVWLVEKNKTAMCILALILAM